MSRVLCSISGIEFNCEHLPLYLDQREYHHPVFCLKLKRLLPLYQRYSAGELNATDSYLLFLAILNSSDLVEFRTPAIYTEHSSSVIANNIEQLFNVVSLITSVRNPKIKFSHIAITPENNSLANIKYWILNWESSYEDFRSGYRAQMARVEISEIEEKIDLLRVSPARTDINFAAKLAEWAAKAGEFPTFQVSVNGAQMSCADYWKQIIRKCVSPDSIFGINSTDLEELTNHCYDNIEVGSIYAHELFSLLKDGAARQHNFLGLSGFSFSILPENSAVEEANRSVIIANAPTKLPNRLDYPSQFAYIKAKLAYEMAQAAETKRELEQLQNTEKLNENKNDQIEIDAGDSDSEIPDSESDSGEYNV